MVLGSEDTVREMIGNSVQQKRYSSLDERILEIHGERVREDKIN